MKSTKYSIDDQTLIIKDKDLQNVLSKVINIELNKNITTLKFHELGFIQEKFLEKLFKIENLKENIRKLDFSNKINARNPNRFNEETLTHLLSELNQTGITELDLSNIEIIDSYDINDIFNLINKSGIDNITIKLCNIDGLKLKEENYKFIQMLKNQKDITIWLSHTSEQINEIIHSIQTIPV